MSIQKTGSSSHVINVVIPKKTWQRIPEQVNPTSVSSCGICGRQELEDMTPKRCSRSILLSAEHLFSMFHELQKQQVVFQQTEEVIKCCQPNVSAFNP